MRIFSHPPVLVRTVKAILGTVRDKYVRIKSVFGEEVWFRHYDAGVPFHLEIEDVPLYHFLDEANRQAAHKTAIIYFNRKFTYRWLHDLSLRFASGLQHLGVRPGDRVALCLPNIPQFLISYWAALYAGAVIVPISPLLSERELGHQIRESRAKIVIVLDRFYSRISRIRSQTTLE